MPAATQCPEQVDLRAGDPRVGGGQVRIRVRQRAFGVEDVEEIDLAFALASAGDAGGGRGVVVRGL